MVKRKARITESAGGVVLDPAGRVLVVNQNWNSWSLPKGHLDKGETRIEAARREIYEESGVDDLQFIRELGSYERPRIGKKGDDNAGEIKRITLFLFCTAQTRLEPQDDRHPEARWVERSKVAELLTHEKDKEFFRKILTGLPADERP